MSTQPQKLTRGQRLAAWRQANIKPLAVRYWAKVDKRGPDECWPWLGNKNRHGYGQIYPGADRAKRPGATMFAHHVALELAGVEVPPGMVRDHICRRRDCQNPAHLRVVTQRFNSTMNSSSIHARNAQATHCAHGHPFSDENTAVIPHKPPGKPVTPSRVCLTCYPTRWRFAIIERRPANARPSNQWIGPFRLDKEAA